MKIYLYILILIQTISISKGIDKCGVEKETCSAFGRWNKTTNQCKCSNLFWGDHCNFGRKRFSSESDWIAESASSYHCNSKYMYLIDSGSKFSSIQLNIKEFESECNWDHLYVFDGRSIYSPLLASLSGSIQTHNEEQSNFITSHSGAMFLYFYSDLNINGKGFNITYKMSKCNSTFCSKHGFCHSANNCTCEQGWTGTNCHIAQCCQDEIDITLNKKRKICKVCDKGSVTVIERASHTAVVADENLWMYGGFTYQSNKDAMTKLYLYDFKTLVWSEISNPQLEFRYGHTMVSFSKSLIIYGGRTMNSSVLCDAWKYEIKTNSWREISAKSPVCVFGHASVVAGSSMYVFFGSNEEETFTAAVQKLNIDAETWVLVPTRGAKVIGRFGHSANYDHESNIVYIFGGFIVRHIVNELLLYDVAQSRWSVGVPAASPVYLHSGTLIGRNLLIFGGNKYNGTDSGSKICHSQDVSYYNLDCKKWASVNSSHLLFSKNRYSHSAVYLNRSLFIFGGFDGELKNDVFRVIIADDASNYATKESCLSSPILSGHKWSKSQSKCVASHIVLPESDIEKHACKQRIDDDFCSYFLSCATCTNAACVWLDTHRKCSHKNSPNIDAASMPVDELVKCHGYDYHFCWLHQNCYTCNENPSCEWDSTRRTCRKSTQTNPRRICYGSHNVTSCEAHKTCGDCLSLENTDCIWCESEKQCSQANTYTVNYAFGQCLEWYSSSSTSSSSCKEVNCSSMKTCHKCFQHPGCGWCSSGTNTGLGECMDGSQLSPNIQTCANDRWHFTECPACYCNGHSGCTNGTDKCERCYGHVTGSHCERCEPGYYGDPQMNGTCLSCYCNGHYRACDGKTGKCECSLKGAIGDHCELCDRNGNYLGNASNNGLCYFHMIVDYHYRSNLTKVTKAAFLARPKTLSSSLKFEVIHTSGAYGYMNVSLFYSSGHTRALTTNHMIGVYRVTIEKDDYEFPEDDVELRFIVFGWKSSEHFAFKATLTHPPKTFDLVYFLIMFLVCFCGLLLLLIIIWKVKQRYDMCVRRRRQKYEMRERISRPSKSIKINLRPKPPELFQRITPTLVGCEEFSAGHLAVGTFLIEYPRDLDGYPPAGSSGLAFGCTLLNMNTKKTFSHKHIYNQTKRRKRPYTAEVNL